ncbi:hypothetical protein O1611_g9576 [Lasiodiplodia mahajangana]|uniref:Uncharacterized protein n=1 Tax=Lasiodiplodia mahajangana TaxID=1108764 RepID=A0ACC2J7X0_9PEZI|nr:hypothetical protein O1611_g9576 [Lasiodiplodia mahajangana]
MDSSNGAVAKESPNFRDTAELLYYLYADLTRLSQVASPNIVLHRFNDPSNPLRGIAAAQAHEEALVTATGGTLVMDVESVVANLYFGAVLGVIRAQSPGLEDLAVPFCGLWRFVDGKPVEHWENTAGDAQEIASWLADAQAEGISRPLVQ